MTNLTKLIGGAVPPPIGKASSELYSSEEYVGIEMELEGILDMLGTVTLPTTLQAITDHSLKFKGSELVFKGPL